MSWLIAVVLTAIITAVIVKLYKDKEIAQVENQRNDSDKCFNNMKALALDMEAKYHEQIELNKELIRQKSSQATKSGTYVEVLSPILEKFPVDIHNKNVSVKWIGDPIDYICFNYEEPMITVVEIKSGDANLSHRQKIVKKALKEGLIRFVEFRMNSNGEIEVVE